MNRCVLVALLFAVAAVAVDGKLKRSCYYSNWSQYRPEPMKFFPEHIDTRLCDYLLFAFAKMEGNRLAPYEWNDESTDWMVGMYERFNNLKNNNAELKTILAVGGWNFGTEEMSEMLSTPENRAEFVSTSIVYLRERNFDGFDLDFEYPGSRGSPPEDKFLFTALVQELRIAFDAEGAETGRDPLLLTAGVAAGIETIEKAYEIPEVCAGLDFINLMSYDLNGAWDPWTGQNSPLYAHSMEQGNSTWLNQAYAINHWRDGGCPAEKIVVGLATYGRSWTLEDPAQNCLRCPAKGASPAGKYTREGGFYSYYEACDLLNNGATRVWEDEQKNPYLYNAEGVWLGYDDKESLEHKVNYIIDENLGGFMFWNLDLDDFNGQFCGEGNFPLVKHCSDVAGIELPDLPDPTTPPPTPSTTTTQGPPGTQPPPADGECPALDGIYAHPDTCLKYVVCNHNEPTEQDCSAGTLYHKDPKICDWPENMSEDDLARCRDFGEYPFP